MASKQTLHRLYPLLLALLIAGCQQPTSPQPAAADDYPPDFALVLTVEPVGLVNASDPLTQPSHYILEADRTLRVALGPGVHHHLYPPTTARLNPSEVAALYEVIRRGGLLTPPEEEPAPSAEVVYRLAITAHGDTHRYMTTAEATPAVIDLLQRLIEIRGG